MWDLDTAALSNTMRLGDDSRGLSIFVSMACDTLYFYDDRIMERWGYILAGGLKLALGGYCNIYAGADMGYAGQMLAAYLQDGWPLSESWGYTMTYLDAEMMVGGLATGSNVDDCGNRLYTMTWQNHASGSYPHLRDTEIQLGCLWYNDSTHECGVQEP